MGLNWRQFELGILRPTLEGEPEVAIKLVGETIWHESDRLRALGQYPRDTGRDFSDPSWDPLKQSPFGPGLGIASIEEATWDWMATMRVRGDKYDIIRTREYSDLAYDLRLNVLACRFRYKVDKRPLPVLEASVTGRADYWFKVYNGSGVASRKRAYIGNALAIEWVK